MRGAVGVVGREKERRRREKKMSSWWCECAEGMEGRSIDDDVDGVQGG
jgi:hypothetical protein